MPQVANQARLLPWMGAAVLGLLALLVLSGNAAALGEQVEALDAHVLPGQPFGFRVTAGVGDTTEQVQVTCGGCGRVWTTAPITNWDSSSPTGQRQRTLSFPSSYFPGSTGQPSHAQNYTVSVVGSGAQANVTVSLVDWWNQPGGVYELTNQVHIQGAGFADGETVHINVSKWTRGGGLNQVAALKVKAGSSGKAWIDWTLPAAHAADMECPHIQYKCRNYTIEFRGAGKVDRAIIDARPATLDTRVVYLIDGPPGTSPVPVNGPLAFNRTQTIEVLVDVRYHNGAPVQPADLTVVGNRTLNGTLRLAVEKVTVGPNGEPGINPDRVAWLYAEATPRGWRANWTIPANASLTTTGAENPQYRMRLVGQGDRWGNAIPDTNGTTFKVHALRIHPRVVEPLPVQVERLVNASVAFTLHYDDGRPFTNQSNTSAMRVRLIDSQGDAVQDARLQHLGQGHWVAWYQPSIKFRPLGFYTLRLDEVGDKDGNEVVRSFFDFFEVVPASPRVELQTKVGHQVRGAEDGFHRGEVIEVVATVRYADGSAYNETRLPQGVPGLNINVTKVDRHGVVHARETIELAAMDDEGRWGGLYGIPGLFGEQPLGDWTWAIEVADRENPPNANRTAFVRPVDGATLSVGITRTPEPLARAGDTVNMRFAARYPDRQGTVLDEGLAGTSIVVEVRTWKDGQAGDKVARLFPQWNTERREWGAAWHTNRTTLVGDYVFAVSGRDVFGNILPQTLTRGVNVFVDNLQRQVLREPAEEVRRGEVVLAVFDGTEGDLGEQGWPAPRVELQKWNPLQAAWETEVRDVRANDTETQDHIARYPTDSTTNLGEYRFFLVARNDQHALVTAASRTFRVLPVEVERAWLDAALDAVASPLEKGALLKVALERREGDIVESAGIFQDGKRLGEVTSQARPGRFDVTWRTAYTLPDGAYQLVVRGRDVHNNSFSTPPLALNLTGVDLEARVPVPPEAAVQRAGQLSLRVLVRYPDAVNVKEGQFVGRFVHQGQQVGQVAMELERAAWFLNWTPPAEAPLGRYSVQVAGTDGLGNVVPADEVFSFLLAEGVIERSFVSERRVANRTENVVWVLPADRNDTEMRFWLRDDAGLRVEVPHRLSTAGDYIVQWRSARDERLGRLTLVAEGSDSAGNAILAEARSLLLRPAQIGIAWIDQPGRTLKPGDVGRWVFQLQYNDGSVLPTSAENAPSVVMLQLERAVEPPPQLERLDQDRWLVSWAPVAGKHTGVYALAVGGQDNLGNTIQATKSGNFRIDEGLIKDIFGVPGFEAWLLPFALGGAALLAARRRR